MAPSSTFTPAPARSLARLTQFRLVSRTRDDHEVGEVAVTYDDAEARSFSQREESSRASTERSARRGFQGTWIASTRALDHLNESSLHHERPKRCPDADPCSDYRRPLRSAVALNVLRSRRRGRRCGLPGMELKRDHQDEDEHAGETTGMW